MSPATTGPPRGPAPASAGAASVTRPCGACRHVIDEFGSGAAVYCRSFVREPDGWTLFPRVERYGAEELYPAHHPHPEWE